MFTGIVEELGAIRSVRRGDRSCTLEVGARVVLGDLKIGDSVAVNGVCLTATSVGPSGFSADVMHETLSRSSLASARPGTPVNLERAMAADGRFGGHIVSGHIDGTGTIVRIERDDNAVWLTMRAARDVMALIVEKGSVAVDGISLTVARTDEQAGTFSVSVIPHTFEVTALGRRRVGDVVNLENDVIGKYVARLMRGGAPTLPDHTPKDGASHTAFDLAFLAHNGFA